ncbi:MAG: hypothetical protein AAF497_29205 [Planctomycetota bacterium]
MISPRYILLFVVLVTQRLHAQDTAPARFLSPLACVSKGKVEGRNIVVCDGLKFQVSQKGHDAYNQFGISHDTKVSGIKVGSINFRSLPTYEELDNGAYSKKLHLDLYDYHDLNGNKNRELIKAGDNIYVTFLVRFMTRAPAPIPGSKFDNDDPRYRRSLFFQFWPGGVATHFNSSAASESETEPEKFGYVTVLTADYGTNKSTLSKKFDVERGKWYRIYFQYNPDVTDGRILARVALHQQDQITDEMQTLIDTRGNTLYADKSHRRILPTFGHYHWGGSPNIVETHFTEVRISKSPIARLVVGQQ